MDSKSNIMLNSFLCKDENENLIQSRYITINKDGNYVVSNSCKIYIYTPFGDLIHSFCSNYYQKNGLFCAISGITCNFDGNYVFTEMDACRIQILTSEGDFIKSFGRYGKKEGELDHPAGIVFDYNNNEYVICDMCNNRIQIFSSEGKFLYSFGKYGEKEGEFKEPLGITINRKGEYAICDFGNKRIQIFKHGGVFTSSFKTLVNYEINGPSAIECDLEGNYLVSYTYGVKVDIFSYKGELIRSLFGFDFVKGSKCDDKGNYIICDTQNCEIKIYKGPSDISTLATLCKKVIFNK